MRDLTFVSCCRGAKEQTPLYRSLGKLGLTDVHFFEHNRRGLPACYNEALDRAAGGSNLVVFAHDDVTVADVFVREKLNESAAHFAVTGLVGSSHFDLQRETPHYAWPVWPAEHLSGAVEHVAPNGQTAWFSLGPTPRRCVVLDGLFLAIDCVKIGPVRFDPRFAFHLYDLDFCLTAHFRGLPLGTTNVYCQHASTGDFSSPEYRRAVQDFRAKWVTALTPPSGRPG